MLFLLCRWHDDTAPIQVDFYEQVPAPVYMWPMVAFATAMLLNALSWSFEQRPARRQLCFLAVYISGVAFVYEALAWHRAAPIYTSPNGRPTSLLRYVMWLHATPAMLYTLSMISDFKPDRVARTVAVDLVMIATAVPGEMLPGWERWVWNAVSCAVFPYLFYQLWCMFSSAVAEARGDAGAQRSLRALRGFTVTFWTVFPLIWAAVQLKAISVRTEETLWGVADICGERHATRVRHKTRIGPACLCTMRL